jgi:hypothetical protein
MRRSLFSVTLIVFSIIFGLSPVQAQDSLRSDSVNVWFDPDFPLPAGQTLKSYYESRKFRFLYREIIPTAVSSDTYFAITGANGGYPDFYGGVQQYKDGSQYAIFSAWDVNSNGACSDCLPGTAAPENQVSVWAKGSRTTTRPFGYEGTGMNSMISGFEWKVGEKIAMLTAVDPAGKGSLISAAFKVGDRPWEFMTSFYVPTRYDVGMSGGYSFVENWVAGNANAQRSYLVGPAILEDEEGRREIFTNLYVAANNPTGDKIPNEFAISPEGSWLRVQTGIGIQSGIKPEYRVQISKPAIIPSYTEGKELIDKFVEGKSTRNEERMKRLEEVAKTKAAADKTAKDNAASEVRITSAKTKYSELSLEIDRLIKKYPSKKSEIELYKKKIALFERIDQVNIIEVELNLAGIESKLVAMRSIYSKLARAINCVQGKKSIKVIDVNPKCPAGYKKK